MNKKINQTGEEILNWYSNLNEEQKNKYSIFMVFTDVENELNTDVIAGNEEVLVNGLAQAMVNDRDFYEVAQLAIECVEEYDRQQAEVYEEFSKTKLKS